MRKISGPLLDRIDLHIEVPSQDVKLLINAPATESTAAIRGRCLEANLFAKLRQGCANQSLFGALLEKHCALASEATSYLHQVAAHFGWSSRSTHRVLKVARTIADLSGGLQIETSHLAEAVQYRRPYAETH
jgi:magnesium chelatase family protein